MANLVVKTNQLNIALQQLTLPEIRIIQLGIVEARETGKGLSTDRPLRIDGMKYAKVFNTTRQNAYILMKKSEDTLFNRRFSYVADDGNVVKSRWISQVKYLNDEGAIEIVFTPAVVEGISRIDGLEKFFTSYLLEQTSSMTSNYSIRLYELLVQWKKARLTPVFKIETFRGQLGLGVNEYKAMNDFKKRVLHVALNEINEKSDLKVSYEQEKSGRRIIGFKFKVLEKPKKKSNKANQLEITRDQDTPDMFSLLKMTDKQRSTFAAKLSKMSELSSKAKQGEDYKQFASRIEMELLDEDKQSFYVPYLKKLGFRTS